MASTAQQLRELFEPSQLEALDHVREALLADPKSLDNHSREVRNAEAS
mgnify:CR=1 FL=1